LQAAHQVACRRQLPLRLDGRNASGPPKVLFAALVGAVRADA